MLDHLKGIQAGGSTPKDNKTAMNQPIDPLASLCLGAVRGWIRVVQHGKGGQIDKDGIAWTRLPAAELRDQLAQEFHVQASVRSIQRALKKLAEADLVRRFDGKRIAGMVRGLFASSWPAGRAYQ